MAKYVNADHMLFDIKTSMWPQSMSYTYALGIIERMLKEAPAADVEPVVHARWKLRGGLFRCTHCDAKALWSMNGGTHLYSREYEQVEAQRCHVCGAHMDEEVTDG